MTSDVYLPLDLPAGATRPPMCSAAGAPTGPQQFHGLPFLIGAARARLRRARPRPRDDRQRRRSAPRRARSSSPTACSTSSCSRAARSATSSPTTSSATPTARRARVPIRERFEIARSRPAGARLPFLARAGPEERPAAALRGALGRRPATARPRSSQGWPRAYYLWGWANPRPDAADRRRSRSSRAGRASSSPRSRSGTPTSSRSCRDGAAGGQASSCRSRTTPASRSTSRSRSTAAWPPTPTRCRSRRAEAFLADGFAGWGEAQNPASSPAYVEIAATPSATVTVRQGGETLGRGALGRLLDAAAPSRRRALRLELSTTAATGCTRPCWTTRPASRSRAASTSARPRACPTSRTATTTTSTRTSAPGTSTSAATCGWGRSPTPTSTARCQGWLPRGEVIVDVARGFEYEPLRTTRADRAGPAAS